MARRIDADEFMKNFEKEIENGATDVFDAVEDALEETPTIEEDHVKHGKWSKPLEGKVRAFQCSLCGGLSFNHGLMIACTYKYCPHCGSRMDGE